MVNEGDDQVVLLASASDAQPGQSARVAPAWVRNGNRPTAS